MAISSPETLNANHDLSKFSCGEPALDHWLKTYALRNQELGFTVVMVVHDAGRVVGYYGLCPNAIVKSSVPRAIRTGMAPDPVPCLLIGQLAVDTDYAKQGIGDGLLKHALHRSLAAAELVGGRALVVQALNPKAAVYWQSKGFVPSLSDPLQLFQPMHKIAASLQAASR